MEISEKVRTRITNEIINRAEYVYNLLQPYCYAIYLGGSKVDEYLENPHDTDFIVFCNSLMETAISKKILKKDFEEHPDRQIEGEDFIQFRTTKVEQKAYNNYINKMQVKLVGNDVDFRFDVIGQDRDLFIKKLKLQSNILKNHPKFNQKRWYQIARGLFILQNNSYELTNEQATIINNLHDMTNGCDTYKEEILEYLGNL